MNKNDLVEKLSFLAAEAFWHGLEEISPGPLLRERLKREGGKILVSGRPWDGKGMLLCCAAGKAAPQMAEVAGEILDGKIGRGLLICPTDMAPPKPLPGFEILPAEHPVPGEGSFQAAAALKAAAKDLKAGDLFLFILSGGATSLLASPVPPITPEELSATFKALLASGADIVDMNIVRKHLTDLGGGRLAELAYPARIETLAVSDVPTDNPSTIGSGPTVDDFSTYALAVGVIERFGLSSRIPENVLRFLKDGIRGKNPETPKKGAPCFLSSRFEILCSARLLLDKMALHLTLLPQVA
ncbi:MAG: glycerate-2-kinase family protein, partial [Bdellovibrionota bacterium]